MISSICGTRFGYQKHRELKEEYCDACKQAEKQYKSKWYNKNKLKILAKHKDWDLKNPEKRKELRRKNERKRRSNKFNNGSDFYTEKQIIDIYGNFCHICLNSIDLSLNRRDPMGFQVDHVIPLSKGGEDKINNVKPSHAICNQQKGNNELTVTLKS
jgi:5-methylcytosine-specific restriction endonuclease McrA